MASASDLIEIILEGEHLGQQIINVHQFIVTEVVNDGDFEDILDLFEDTILPGMEATLAVDFEWGQITINNISDPDEFAQRAVSVPGVNAGDSMPPHSAASIKLQRGSKVTRNGYRRHGGLVEDAQADGVLTGAFITALESAYTFLLGPVSAGTAPDTITITAIILGRLTNGDYDVTRWQFPASLQVQSIVTTQRSRKIGVGR